MKIQGTKISRVTATAKKAEAVIVLDPANQNHDKAIKQLNNFIDRPIDLILNVNAADVLEEMERITPEQNKKLHALWGDIAEFIGDIPADVKEQWKEGCRDQLGLSKGYSLADITKDQASQMIDLIVTWCIRENIALSERPDKLTGVQEYMQACLHYRKCCICGKPGEVHHYDTIGMGNNRKKTDDADKLKMCLCRQHHAEIHQIGGETFCEKYHVEPVKFDG
jgi:hypothetical protein